jgi:hypothetical protein
MVEEVQQHLVNRLLKPLFAGVVINEIRVAGKALWRLSAFVPLFVLSAAVLSLVLPCRHSIFARYLNSFLQLSAVATRYFRHQAGVKTFCINLGKLLFNLCFQASSGSANTVVSNRLLAH